MLLGVGVSALLFVTYNIPGSFFCLTGPSMSYLLALVACLGHLVLLVGTHNWVYGLNLPKRLSKVNHLVHLLAFLALPTGLVLGWGPWLEGLFVWPPSCTTHAVILTYLGVCFVAATVLLPAITLRRRTRRDAALSPASEVVDHRGTRRQFLPGNEIYRVEYRTFTLRPPRLPAALDGLTVLHLTDLHFHGVPDREWFEEVVERCNAWKPDIVTITGDVADSERHHRWIVPILGRLRWNVAGLAILGNHDYRLDANRIRRRLRKIGFRVLANTWETVDVRGTPLIAVGHEGPWLAGDPDLSGCPPEAFRLALSHTPDNVVWLQKQGMDVALCGHVHAGQIRFPVIGPVFMPSIYGRTFDHGVFALDPTLMVVGRGLSGEHPVRYNCLPEVSLITLRSGG